MPPTTIQNINNRDSIVHKRNKLNDVTKGNSRKPNSTDQTAATPSTTATTFNNNNSNNNNNKKNNVTKNNQLNNGAMKNDTYESVCSPEDVAERTKMAQRHTALNNCNSNSSIGSTNSSSNSSHSSSSNNNNSTANLAAVNNTRNLKRNVAPSPPNEIRSKFRENEYKTYTNLEIICVVCCV